MFVTAIVQSVLHSPGTYWRSRIGYSLGRLRSTAALHQTPGQKHEKHAQRDSTRSTLPVYSSSPAKNCLWELHRHMIHTSSKCQVLEDRKAKTLALWRNVREVKTSPIPALSLSLAGLIPFMAAPAYMMMSQTYLPDVAFAQVAYGATILSFLGGVRWGFVLPEENPMQPDWINLGYSILPPLVAWGGLMLPQPLSLFTMMTGLTAAAYADMAMYGYPPWFKGLRFLMSFVAILSLWTTFMCRLMLTQKDSTKQTDMEHNK